jgi:hypothetical protein
MKLRFYARTGHLVPDPRQTRRVQGEIPMCVGRAFVASSDPTKPHQQVATEEATVLDTDSLDPERLASTLRDVTRESLWCADKATADFCQVQFVPLSFDKTMNVWAPAAPETVRTGGKS